MLLIDDETRTYWDHITGEAVHGPLKGIRMDAWAIEMTNVQAALKNYPDLALYQSELNLIGKIASWLHKKGFVGKRVPFFFRRTMGERDSRLPEMEIGLAVINGNARRFYTMDKIKDGIEDELGGRSLKLNMDPDDGVPCATWSDDSTRPMQLFSRWYGISYTYPGCEIYGDSEEGK